MARQHLAGRRYVRDRRPKPPYRVWDSGRNNRDHGVDDDAAMVPAREDFHNAAAPRDLLPRRHERGAVLERPAIVLNMRDFDPFRIECQCKLDHLADPVDIAAVNDRVTVSGSLSRTASSPATLRAKGALVAGNVIGEDSTLS